jgi:MoxR-like ATPase
MASLMSEEEKAIKERLINLEKKYRENLFSRSTQEQLEKEISKDILAVTTHDAALDEDGRRVLQEEMGGLGGKEKDILPPLPFENLPLNKGAIEWPKVILPGVEQESVPQNFLPNTFETKPLQIEPKQFAEPDIKLPTGFDFEQSAEFKPEYEQPKGLIIKPFVESDTKEFLDPESNPNPSFGAVKVEETESECLSKPQAAALGIPKSKYRNSDVEKPTEDEVKKCAENIIRIKKEIGKAVIGQEAVIEGLIMGLICNAHVLVEGVPGIAKTLVIRALANASGCKVKRIQFTVDMLPTDIIGITSYTPKKGFEVIKGPVFTNFLIADEINRSPPKTQSALIEAMQEKQVTIGRKRYFLPSPFFVMATENPIENAGVYPLPEAQIDRFLFKLIVPYPKPEAEMEVMGSNITIQKFEDFKIGAVITPEEIVWMQEIAKRVYLDDSIRAYILSIVTKTRDRNFKSAEYLSYGSSPRASIGLFIASKAKALMEGRNFVLPEDVKSVVFDVLRHRLILSYKATIQKVSPDSIIQEILNSIRVV